VTQGALEASVQEVLSQIQTLQLVHRLDLRFSLDFRFLKLLVLVLNAVNFTLDLIFPIVAQRYLALLVVRFELSNFLQLSFFLYFK